MKNLYIVFIIILSTFSAYGESYISEINFVGDEFVEIVSNEGLNLSNSRVFDDNGQDKENTVKLLKNAESEINLIVGQNFKNNNNLDDYNCNIYETDKSQVSNGGLKSGGENLTILTQENQTIKFVKGDSYDFQDGESLHYNNDDDSYFVSNYSLCSISIVENQVIIDEDTSDNIDTNDTIKFNESDEQEVIDIIDINETDTEIEIETETNTNESIDEDHENEEINEDVIVDNNPTDDTSDCEFNIISDLIYTDKLTFKFETNQDNFNIMYWVEDFLGNIVKEPRNTTNTNLKSFTPENKKEIYLIKSRIKSNSCEKESEKLAFFYTQNIEINENTNDETTDRDLLPSIKILSNISDKELEFEIYRGDSSKRTIKITQNSREIAKFEVDKYSKIKGKIDIIPFYGDNNFKISGFDIEDSILISSENYAKINEKKYFTLKNLKQINSTLSFEITSNIEELGGFCYARYIKSPMTILENISLDNEIQYYNLSINESKLKIKSKKNKNNLEVVCKYKQENLKTYRYKKAKIDYQIEPKIKADYTIKTKIFTEGTELNNNSNSSDVIKSKIKVYNSKNEEIKEKSAIPVLTAMSALLATLLSKW